MPSSTDIVIRFGERWLQDKQGIVRELEIAASQFRPGDEVELPTEGWCEIEDMYAFSQEGGDCLDAVVWTFPDDTAVLAEPWDTFPARLRVR